MKTRWCVGLILHILPRFDQRLVVGQDLTAVDERLTSAVNRRRRDEHSVVVTATPV